MHTSFILKYMPIVLATEPSDEFLRLESDVRTGVHVLPVQPGIAPLDCNWRAWFSYTHLLFLHFSRAKLLPEDGVVRHPRLHGLPKYIFGEVRRQPAYDGLEAFRPSSFARSLSLLLCFRSRLVGFLGGLGSRSRHQCSVLSYQGTRETVTSKWLAEFGKYYLLKGLKGDTGRNVAF